MDLDLLIDLVDFMMYRAQQRGFDSPEQVKKYSAVCKRILQIHPQAVATVLQQLQAETGQNLTPAPAPQAIQVPAVDWGML